MRLNLNCRDADIKQINSSEYRITFDLSNMIKPRLSENARMYIEHLNLPEFVDEAYGKINGELRGYFELRCDNLDSNDFDTEFGNTGNNILFTSPLANFKTFTNNDPMYISNFKVNQNFLQNRLVMTLKVYDQWGNPYTTAKTVSDVIDESTPQFTAYKTSINDFNVLNKEKERVDILLEDAERLLQEEESKKAGAGVVLNKVKEVLIDTIDDFLKKDSVKPRNKFKAISLRDLIDPFRTNVYIYLFEVYLPPKYGEEPYNKFESELKAFYASFLNFAKFEYNVIQLQADRDNIRSSKIARLGSTAMFDSIANNVRPDAMKTVNYTVNSATTGLAVKSGTVKVQYFLSNDVDNGFSTIIVDDITPASGATNVLVINDELIINKSNIITLVPSTYEYAFIKSGTSSLPGVTVPLIANNSRFALIVNRTATAYNITFREDLYESVAFVAGSTIKINGDQLGGVSPANDLQITIDSIFIPPASEDYSLTDFKPNDFLDNGFMDLEITRDNTTLSYSLKDADFSNTCNYAVGDEIVIDGDELDGKKGINDAYITVNKVLLTSHTYPHDESTITHSIPTITVTDSIGKVFDATGAQKPGAKDFTIFVSSINGVYDINFDDTLDASTGFAVGDFIIVNGADLSGDAVENDLNILIISVKPSGKIFNCVENTSIPSIARYPSDTFGFDVIRKINSNSYEIANIVGDEFAIGDTLTVDGGLLGGFPGINDVSVEVLSVILEDPTDITGMINAKAITGFANFDTTFDIKDSSILHTILPITINSTNSDVVDSTGAPNTLAKDYVFHVSSINGVYNIQYDESTDISRGFNAGDIITIKGSVLTGIDTINDLKVVVKPPVTPVGSISSQGIETEPTGTYVARYPSTPFGFIVMSKMDTNTYEIGNIIGDGFFIGDQLLVFGNELNGISGPDNNLLIQVTNIERSDPTSTSILTGTITGQNIIGTPNFVTGISGQILGVDAIVQGTSEEQIEGEITGFTIDPSSVPVNVATLTTPNILITIKENPFEGLSVVEANIAAKYTDVDVKKAALVSTNKVYITKLGAYQEQKMRCMNIRLVLYDEVPDFTQASGGALTANTYSRLTGCQFKRI